MRPFLFTLIASSVVVASCASEKPAQEPPPPMKGAFVLNNQSRSTLTVQPFEAGAPGEVRPPIGDAFTIPPGRTESRIISQPGKFVVLTIRASDQNFKYQSGEWVIRERIDGFHIYAFTDDSGTVRLSWYTRDGEVILMQ